MPSAGQSPTPMAPLNVSRLFVAPVGPLDPGYRLLVLLHSLYPACSSFLLSVPLRLQGPFLLFVFLLRCSQHLSHATVIADLVKEKRKPTSVFPIAQLLEH